MCRQMREGQSCRMDRSNLADQKDARLDLVVWRPFRDDRPGKLMGFGQCATGGDWPDKLTHLQPETFCSMWLADSPVVPPARMFFVPFRIGLRRWMDVGRKGGIIFDRCRIAFSTRHVDEDLMRECAEWTSHVVKEQLER